MQIYYIRPALYLYLPPPHLYQYRGFLSLANRNNDNLNWKRDLIIGGFAI